MTERTSGKVILEPGDPLHEALMPSEETIAELEELERRHLEANATMPTILLD